MIEIKNVSFKYSNSETASIDNVSLNIKSGECVLVCGESGCGKTTITRLINGLIPHYYEGEIKGDVTVNGLDVTKAELYETAHLVGSVFQNPRSQFFCVDTTSEIAFGCENIGLDEEVINKRIKESTDELEMSYLLGRNIFGLSGGEKQKVACASVSAIHPDVFVLDEPTSNLDIDAIESLKKTLKLWKSRGKTIVISEHRLYWLKDICDRVIYVKKGKVVLDVPMSEFENFIPQKINQLGLRTLSMKKQDLIPKEFKENEKIKLKNYSFFYDKKNALDIPSLTLSTGSVVAVIGHNGAGKSTFSKCLCGLEKKFKGKTTVNSSQNDRKDMLKKSYMVMQDVNHQLFCESVDDEVRLGMDDENTDIVPNVLSKLELNEFANRHPMSLSGGQKQRVAIASATLANKEVLIFDEPTSGLDFKNMEQTAQLISSLGKDKTVFIVTHDPELILRCCTHVLHLENGSVVENYRLNNENLNKFRNFFNIK